MSSGPSYPIPLPFPPTPPHLRHRHRAQDDGESEGHQGHGWPHHIHLARAAVQVKLLLPPSVCAASACTTPTSPHLLAAPLGHCPACHPRFWPLWSGQQLLPSPTCFLKYSLASRPSTVGSSTSCTVDLNSACMWAGGEGRREGWVGGWRGGCSRGSRKRGAGGHGFIAGWQPVAAHQAAQHCSNRQASSGSPSRPQGCRPPPAARSGWESSPWRPPWRLQVAERGGGVAFVWSRYPRHS